jgi:hypothetical protein
VRWWRDVRVRLRCRWEPLRQPRHAQRASNVSLQLVRLQLTDNCSSGAADFHARAAACSVGLRFLYRTRTATLPLTLTPLGPVPVPGLLTYGSTVYAGDVASSVRWHQGTGSTRHCNVSRVTKCRACLRILLGATSGVGECRCGTADRHAQQASDGIGGWRYDRCHGACGASRLACAHAVPQTAAQPPRSRLSGCGVVRGRTTRPSTSPCWRTPRRRRMKGCSHCGPSRSFVHLRRVWCRARRGAIAHGVPRAAAAVTRRTFGS